MLKTIYNFLRKKPILCVYNISGRCNSRCPMCNFWRSPQGELTLPEMKRLFLKLKDGGLRYINLQGGEPLLRKDILEIVEFLITAGLKPTLITNGTLLKEKLILKLVSLPTDVIVSLDTLSKAKYRKIRGIDAFDKVKKNLQLISSLKRKGFWKINMIILRTNQDEILNLYEFSQKLGFGFSCFPYNYGIGIASFKDENLFYNPRLVSQRLKELYQKDQKNFFYFPEMISYIQGKEIGPCDAGQYSIAIDSLGRISPCLEMTGQIDFLDSLESLDQVLEKFDFKKIKLCSKRTPCFYGCTRPIGILRKHKILLLKKSS